METWLIIFSLSFVQNISFSIVSRARNRSNQTYHAIASVFSNGLWFLTMHHLVAADLTYLLAIPYIAGTVLGSLFGSSISMRVEKAIGAVT